MFSWFLNPWMLLGGLAVASPILIHLLNKRRFKIVQWAAMDFLLQADKKNRRRVELENLILLLLRCLAMLLLAFLLARPFLPSQMVSFTQQADKYERVVLIDDSLSQRVVNNQLPAIENIKTELNQWLGQLATSDMAENRLTLFLTSRPEQPLLANEPITLNTMPNISQTIADLQTSDGVADYRIALTAMQRYLQGQRDRSGQVFYLFSDLRERDWLEGAETDQAPNQLLNEIADNTLGCFLLDVGSPLDDNLAVTNIRPDGLLIADRLIRFNVTVANYSDQPALDTRLLFQVGDGQPQFETIAQIGPNQSQQASFVHYFPLPEDDPGLAFSDEEVTKRFDSYPIRSEIDRSSLSAQALAQDQLIEDSSAVYAATVARKISVLLVDGDPSTDRQRSETHYLRSLAVPGTGLEMKVVTVGEFETIPLSQFQVIYLCNVDEVSSDRIQRLTSWVENGGGLVIMPGNRVRAATFNNTFYDRGNGLVPLTLSTIGGSPTMTQWVNFDVTSQVHPALKIVVDSDVTSLSNVDIFSWWNTEWSGELDADFEEESVFDQSRSGLFVPLKLTDEKNSPAMIDRSLGQGRVIMFTIPADGDWSMWPASPTYAPVMIDLIDYLIGNQQGGFNLRVGGSIAYPVELAVYQNRVSLRDPKNEKIESVARPISQKSINLARDQDSLLANGQASDDADSNDDDLDQKDGNSELELDSNLQSDTIEGGVAYGVQFDELAQRGFYTLELRQHTGLQEEFLFAVNYDPRESQLKRLPVATLESNFFSSKVKRMAPNQLVDEQVAAGTTEILTHLLIFLFGVLVTEQVLGWWWGRNR